MESGPIESHLEEIRTAFESAGGCPPHVALVPIRMTEAWLLHDLQAIRTAADDPNGTRALRVPPLARLERLPNPKKVLRDALLAATEASGRRLQEQAKRFPVRRLRVAELIEDYAPLRNLSAFQAFEKDLDRALEQLQR
jgi:hypothetical protein